MTMLLGVSTNHRHRLKTPKPIYQNAVAVGLIENLPLDKRVSEDLFRWLSVETFEGCEKLFRYHLSDEEYRRFLSEFFEKKKGFRGAPHL